MKKKMEKVTEEIANCSIFKTMELFQSKWNMWILYELGKNESMRFSELQRAIPNISKTMLTSSLKYLEEHKLVNRVQFNNEVPLHVEYSATDSAKALKKVYQAMSEWGDTYIQ